MKVKRFHQLVHLERGPVNTAVLDFLKGSLFQVENAWIDSFFNSGAGGGGIDRKKVIAEFEAEGLLIEVEEKTWIPAPELDPVDPSEVQLILEIEDGTDLDRVRSKLAGLPIILVNDYRRHGAEDDIRFAPTEKKKKDFRQCRHLAAVTGTFKCFNEDRYGFNRSLNTCWGRKIAVTGDNQVRPCIMSQVAVGDLRETDISTLFKGLEVYWGITKDRVDTCKDCELRYVCFDCREIARRQDHNLFAANPLCRYDPHAGAWRDA